MSIKQGVSNVIGFQLKWHISACQAGRGLQEHSCHNLVPKYRFSRHGAHTYTHATKNIISPANRGGNIVYGIEIQDSVAGSYPLELICEWMSMNVGGIWEIDLFFCCITVRIMGIVRVPCDCRVHFTLLSLLTTGNKFVQLSMQSVKNSMLYCKLLYAAAPWI